MAPMNGEAKVLLIGAKKFTYLYLLMYNLHFSKQKKVSSK